MKQNEMRRKFRLAMAAFAIVSASACDRSADRGQLDGAPGDSASAPPDTLFVQPSLLIGLDDGGSDYVFGSVSAVAADDRYTTYVGDGHDASVRAFDRDGRLLAWVAREGGGPGEITYRPAGMTFSADGRLYVRDALRVNVFAKRGDGSVADSAVGTLNFPGSGNLAASRGAVAGDGRYFDPEWTLSGEVYRSFYVSYSDGVADGDTLEVPPYLNLARLRLALLRLGTDALMLDGLSRVPFSAVPVWDVTPAGTLISSDGFSGILLETDLNGDTLRVIRLPEISQRPIPSGARADSLKALEERIASVPGDLSQVAGLGEGVEERRLPEYLPMVVGLAVTRDGSIWVERWPPEGAEDRRYYDVLDPTGGLRRVIVLEAPMLRDPAPWFGDRAVVGVVRDSITEVERVVRFDLP